MMVFPIVLCRAALASDIDFEALLDNMDLSRDGTIHWHEVRHSEGFKDLPKDVRKAFKKAFTEADLNKDHVLVPEEFKKFYAKTEHVMQDRDRKLVDQARERLHRRQAAGQEDNSEL